MAVRKLYHNCDATFNLEFLSLCGGINPNPGPTAGKTASKFSVCGRVVAKNQLAITCGSCYQLSCSNYCWDCPTCVGNLLQQLPFANVDNIIEQDPANDNPLQNMGSQLSSFQGKTTRKNA